MFFFLGYKIYNITKLIMAKESTITNFSELTFTQDDFSEINTSVCSLWVKFKGRLKNITIQNQRAFINYGKHQNKIEINLVESNYIVVNQNILNEKNNVSYFLLI